MTTLSKTIHDALAKIEAWIDKIEHEQDTGPTPGEVKTAVATIRAQANAVDPKLPAATVPTPAQSKPG